MTPIEQISEMFSALGPQNSEITGVVQHASSPAWAVEFTDEGIVEAALHEERGKLTFSADLGRPEPGTRLGIYEAMLLANAFGSSTDGIAMSLSEPDGCLTQTFDLDLRDLTDVVLQNVVANFALKASYWRELVACGAADEGSAPAAAGQDGEKAPEIRV